MDMFKILVIISHHPLPLILLTPSNSRDKNLFLKVKSEIIYFEIVFD